MTLRFSLACLCGFLPVFLLGGCRDTAQIEALNAQIRSLEATQKQAKTDLSRVQLQLRTLQQETEAIESEKVKLELQLKEAKESLEALLEEFKNYKTQYKVSVQRQAPGMRLDDILLDGRNYRNVRVRELTDSMLTIMHQAGTASLPLHELPAKLQRLMGYEAGFPIVLKHGGNASGSEGGERDERKEAEAITAELARLSQQHEDLRSKLAEGRIAAYREKDDPDRKLVIDRSNAALEVQLTHVTVKLDQLKAEQRKMSVSARAGGR